MDILQWHCGNFSCRQGGRCFIANAPPLNSSENYWMAFVTARSHQAELMGTTLEICDRIFIYLLPYKSGFVLQRAIKQQPFLTYQLQQEVPMQNLSSTPSFRFQVYSSAQHQFPHRHPLVWSSKAMDSPRAEWQTCCWGCAGAQLHASPSPGGHSNASSRSTSAQLSAARGLQGMTLQSPC